MTLLLVWQVSEAGVWGGETAQRWAVLVGVDKYLAAGQFRELRYCRADVEQLAKCLQEVGFSPGNIVSLVSSSDSIKTPSCKEIKRAIEDVLAKAAVQDLVIIAFSGHGFMLDGRTYLCPCDADVSRPAETMIAIDWLYEVLRQSKAAQRILLVDACRNSVGTGRARGPGEIGSRDLIKSLRQNLPRGLIVLTSASENQVSWELDQLGHGVFSYFVIQGLRGAADIDVQGNNDGQVSWSELFEYASEKTALTVRRYQKSEQTPQMLGEGQPFVVSRPGRYIVFTVRSQENGAPVAGVEVSLIRQPAEGGTAMQWQVGKTDPDGQVGFRLPTVERTDVIYTVRIRWGKKTAERVLNPLVGPSRQEIIIPLAIDQISRRLLWAASGSRGMPRTLTFSSDGDLLAVGMSNGAVAVWEWKKCRLAKRLIGHQGEVKGVAFVNGSRLLVSGANDGTVFLWDMNASDGNPLRSFAEAEEAVNHIAVSPGGKYVAAALDNGEVILWDRETGELFNKLNVHTTAATCVAFSPDGRILASGGADRTVMIWRVSDNHLLRTLRGQIYWVTALSFSPNGKWLAASSLGNAAVIWDTETGEPVRGLVGHTGSVRNVAFHPTAEIIATASLDKTVNIWSAKTALLEGTIRGHTLGIEGLGFSPDGKWLATGAQDGTVRIWSITDLREIAAYIAFSDGGWLAISPQGYYDGSTDIIEGLVLTDPESKKPLSNKEKASLRKPSFLGWEPVFVDHLPPPPAAEPARP